MDRAPATALCPTCRTPLPGGTLTGICPGCAWLEIEAEAEASSRAGPADALFLVPGHDVLEELGRGGGGLVYRARQHQPRRDVALKILPPALLASPAMQARFRMEAETVAALDHPAILPVYLVGEKDGLPYFTMKLATGGTLAARSKELEGNWRAIAGLVAGLAEAVQYAHVRGVVHRDLKPGNVLFDDEGRAYISDFGLAKFTTVEPSMTRSQVVMGTPAYLAPEVVAEGAGAATTASDVYGLGAVLYELLAGSPPFAGESIPELLRQIAGDNPVSPRKRRTGIPRDLEVIALRCLEKDPARRLSSAGAVAEDLQRWLAHRPILARPVPPAERVAQWTRRNPALAGLTALLAVALIGGGAALVRSNRHLRDALQQTAAAERAAEERLHQSLLDQARLWRASGKAGQRHEALDALTRAATIRRTAEVRSEVAAALARPDVRLERNVPAAFLDERATIAFAPDFETYLSYSGREDFVLMSTAEGKLVRRFRPAGDGRARHFAFSRDGRTLAATFVDGRTEGWKRDGETPGWTIAPLANGRAAAFALHPTDGGVAWADAEGTIWRRMAGAEPRRLRDDAGMSVSAMQFSPDGRALVVVRGAEVSVIEATTGAVTWARAGEWAEATPVWSEDEPWLAVAGSGAAGLVVFDRESGRSVQAWSTGNAAPRLLAFQANSHRVAAVTADGWLRVWDVRNGEPVLQMPMPPRVLAFSADGSRMAGASAWLTIGVYAWTGEVAWREFFGAESKERLDAIEVSPDGALVATSGAEGIRMWDTRAGRAIGGVALPAAGWTSVHFSRDGRELIHGAAQSGVWRRAFTVAAETETDRGRIGWGEPRPVGENRDGRVIGFGGSAGSDWFIEREKIGQVVVWPGGDPAKETKVVASEYWDRPEVSADGKWIALMGYPLADVRLFAIGAADAPRRLELSEHAGAGFSPDGRWLVTGTQTEYRVWALPGLTLEASWPGRIEQGWGTPYFSPDGRWLALEGQQGGLELRDTGTFDVWLRLTPPHPISLQRVAWSPDATKLYLMTAGHRVVEWDLTVLRRELAARGLE